MEEPGPHESKPLYPVGPGQRALAAIMFTDTVGFSRRVHQDEVETLHRLDADLTRMREFCDQHAGSVLKSTGDGLLVYFTSAVQALACALELQRYMAARRREEPAAGHLTHRVGIHLGEVFTSDSDVMGDGVNIAARLQTEAEPGGISISQTVHDVVKNKLEFTAVRLNPRPLKNIKEQIGIYRIVIEPDRVSPAPLPLPVLPKTPPADESRPRKLLLALVSAAVFAGAAGWWWWAQQQQEAELARSRAAQADLDQLLRAREKPAEADAATDRVPPAERIAGLWAWMDAELPRHGRDNPLAMWRPPGALGRDTKVFVDAAGRLTIAEGGAERQRNLRDLRPEEQAALMLGALLGARPVPARAVWLGLETFAAQNGLTEMASTARASAPAN
jgi:class 3 adenylate cyclase